MAHDRLVAGIRCFEVLALLSEYLDGELTPPVKARVDAHLAGCSWCAHFGGEVGDTIRQLHATLEVPEPVPEDVSARLAARLKRDLDDAND